MKHEFDFALTTYCQAKCRSCARTNEETGEKEDWLELKHMRFSVYERLLDNFVKDKNKEDIRITFCGEFGDPVMHPDIAKFVDATAPRVKDLVIKTNGGLRQPEWYKEIGTKYDNIIFHFGIDGTTEEVNSKYREGVNFDRAMENMKAWFNTCGNGAWHFLIFDWNWHQIPEVHRISQELDCGVNYKFNNREFGLITAENKERALELLRDIGEI